MKKWLAKWIGYPQCPVHTAPAFQRKVTLHALPASAEVYVSGLGAYVLYINGQRVGEDILQPAFSDYNKTVYYNHMDVTEYLHQGENTLCVVLGNVWYHEQQATDWQFESAPWKDFPRMILELWTEEALLCKTDAQWLCAQSRTIFNSLRCGERYDASRTVDFKKHATVVPPPRGIMKEQTIAPIRVCQTYEPVQIITQARYFGSRETQLIYDFGINLSGNVELIVKGKPGATVTLTYFEKLLSNGLHEESLLARGLHSAQDRGIFQKDVYTLCGEGEEHWHSEFGYNGFRYVGVRGDFDSLKLQARCFHTILPQAGDIEADHPLITKLQAAVKQSTLTNFHHIPTDCPHREKLGWTCDGGLSAEQALFNFDIVSAYSKWMADFADSQQLSGAIPCVVPSTSWGHSFNCGPCWDQTLFEIPWQMYLYTADESYLRQTFDVQRRYMEYLPGILEDGLCSLGLSDWLAPVNMGTLSPDEAVITLLCGRICQRFAQISHVLRECESEEQALQLRDLIRKAYLDKYADLDVDSQTVYALQLMFDFTDDRDATLQKLIRNVQRVNYHVNGGVFTAKYLLDALTLHGRFDLAWKVSEQTDYPGWGYNASVNSGTLGEDWGGGQSGNHHFLSEISAWYYKALAGIRIDENNPGFRNVVLQPNTPSQIGSFRAWHATPFGKLEVSWDRNSLFVEIPEGVTASFRYGGQERTLSYGCYQFSRED